MKFPPLFYAVVFLVITSLFGCVSVPRIFQKEVPKPAEKTPAQIETDRRAADLISRKLEKPVELIPVAKGLSFSLGAPKKPIKADTPEELATGAAVSTAELQASIVAMQKQLLQLNKTLLKYQGRDIEGTGLSLLGPGMVTLVLVLIALGVFFPPAFALMAMAYRRLKATGSIIVNQLEDAANAPETREAVNAVKKNISKAMGAHSQNTKALKAVVLDLKKA